jgi:hypothetical protein
VIAAEVVRQKPRAVGGGVVLVDLAIGAIDDLIDADEKVVVGRVDRHRLRGPVSVTAPSIDAEVGAGRAEAEPLRAFRAGFAVRDRRAVDLSAKFQGVDSGAAEDVDPVRFAAGGVRGKDVAVFAGTAVGVGADTGGFGQHTFTDASLERAGRRVDVDDTSLGDVEAVVGRIDRDAFGFAARVDRGRRPVGRRAGEWKDAGNILDDVAGTRLGGVEIAFAVHRDATGFVRVGDRR